MDRLRRGGHARLLHGLAEGRVRVARPRDVLGRGAVLHAQDALGDHLAGVRADDVHAEDLVRGRVREDLDHALGIADGARARVRAERERADLVLYVSFLELLLGPAHRRELGVRVDDARDRVVVHVAREAGDVLHARDALLLGLVREHGAVDHVPEGEDRGHLGAEVLVHLDPSQFVGLDAQVLQPQPLREGAPARGHQDNIEMVGRRVAAFRRGVRQRHALLGDFRRLHRGLELELHALLLEQPQKGLAYVLIRPGHDVVQKLDHGHLGAQSPPDRAHLEADHACVDSLSVGRPRGTAVRPHAIGPTRAPRNLVSTRDRAAADHGHGLRDLLQVQSAGGVHDAAARVVHGARG